MADDAIRPTQGGIGGLESPVYIYDPLTCCQNVKALDLLFRGPGFDFQEGAFFLLPYICSVGEAVENM